MLLCVCVCVCVCACVCVHACTRSVLSLCKLMDGSPQGSSAQGISQASILDWIAIFYSRGSSQPKNQTCVSCIGRWILYHCTTREVLFQVANSYLPAMSSHGGVKERVFRTLWCLFLLLSHVSRARLCVTPYTAAHQAPPSLGFSRQEYWSGLPFPSPVHESEKWKWSRSVVSDSSRPHGL